VWTGPGRDEQQIYVQSLETGERRLLVQGGSTGRYISTGHLVYARADALMAVPMDLARLEVTGAAPAALTDVVRGGGEGVQYAVSDLGELVYWRGDPRRYERRLVWVERDGRIEPLPAPVREYSSAKISPDGLQAAVEIQGGTLAVWLYDFSRATLTPLTTGPSSQNPIWTADGKRVLYRGTRMGVRNVFWKAVDGGSEEERLTTKQGVSQTPGAVSTDGKWLVFTETDPSTGGNIWALQFDGDRKPQGLLTSRFAEGTPSLSPDGRWLAYRSDESGRNEIYVQPFPGPGGKRLISTEGGEGPMWSRNGRELFYESGDKLMVVDIATQPALTTGPPRLLFRGRFEANPTGGRGYDVSPDGQRFLRVQAIAPEQPATHINVVMNWFEELKQKTSAKTTP
jgi:dipeptidyl aminopeptidase/acylaminoacyl peptidase